MDKMSILGVAAIIIVVSYYLAFHNHVHYQNFR